MVLMTFSGEAMSKRPFGVDGLIDLRTSGMVPEHPVLVSLVGKLPYTNLTLLAKAGERYDWHAIAALEVELIASTQVPFSALLATLADIARAVPKRMVLTFTEGPRIECGEMRTLRDFALFDWFPMAIAPICWPQSRHLAKRLWEALGNELPIPYDEAAELIPQVALEELRACS